MKVNPALPVHGYPATEPLDFINRFENFPVSGAKLKGPSHQSAFCIDEYLAGAVLQQSDMIHHLLFP
jgi:hypothetical protein